MEENEIKGDDREMKEKDKGIKQDDKGMPVACSAVKFYALITYSHGLRKGQGKTEANEDQRTITTYDCVIHCYFVVIPYRH